VKKIIINLGVYMYLYPMAASREAQIETESEWGSIADERNHVPKILWRTATGSGVSGPGSFVFSAEAAKQQLAFIRATGC